MRYFLILLFGVAFGYSSSLITPSLLGYLQGHQTYASQQGRAISSLSAKDVEQLTAGQGWGLAKPAEFNGYPGPAHIIEHSEALSLSEKQLEAVRGSFARMKARAVVLGEELVSAERALDRAFIDKRVTEETLRDLLAKAEAVRAQLRNVHLSAHLEVTPLLSENQKARYAQLRGYGSGNHNGHGGH